MAPRAHLDLDAAGDQEVPVPEHVVEGGHLEVHVAQPGPLAAEHGQLVVHRVDPDQAGGVAQPVRDPRVEPGTPEPVGLVHVRRVQAQVAELGDPGRQAERDRPGHRLLLADEFQPVAERIVERDELPDPPGSRLRRVTAAHPEPGGFQFGLGRGQRVRIGHGKAGGDHPGGSLDQREAVVPVVGAQVRHPGPGPPGFGRRDQFQADDVGREADRRLEVGHAGPDVGDVGERDHGQLRRRPGRRRCRSASRGPGPRRRRGCPRWAR